MCPYFFSISIAFEGLQPISDETTANGTPPSSMRVITVCLRSWNRTQTPASLRALPQALFQDRMGFLTLTAYRIHFWNRCAHAPYRSAGKTKSEGCLLGHCEAHVCNAVI